MTDALLLDALASYSKGALQLSGQKCDAALESAGINDLLAVRLIHLRLTATTLWWSVAPSEDVRWLVQKAMNAAERTQDRAAMSLSCGLLGSFLLATESLPSAMALFENAADHAMASNSALAMLESLGNLGHYGVGRDLNRGLAVLRRAQALAVGGKLPRAAQCEQPLVAMWKGRLNGLVGVGEFDCGSFGDAEVNLRNGLEDLKKAHAWDQVAMIANYYGQLLSATGRFEEAEVLLQKALGLLHDDAGLSAHHGYNLGLIGKLYLEWRRLADAETHIRSGWDRVARSKHQGLLPLLRNYLGELLVDEDYNHRDVDQAKALFDETVEECARNGFQRSEIGALVLRAKADLATGDVQHAEEVSRRAVDRLDDTGTLPALRNEEVYFARYRVLRACGEQAESQLWLERARSLVRRKAQTLASTNDRSLYYERVPLNQQIMSAR